MRYHFDTVKEKYYKSIALYRYELIESGSKIDGLSQLEEYDDIEKWDFNLKLFENEANLPPGYSVGFEYLYIDENDEVVGMVNFRPFALKHPFLSKYGGHVGYNIKPSKRNLGIGNQMLKDFLPICKEYGLDKILITCMSYNEASRKIIINNGGIFIDEIIYPPENKIMQRYWINL